MSKPTAVIVGVGAERGLGAALCRRFAAEGYHVLVAGRGADKIKNVVQTIAAAGGSAEPVVADATSEGDISRLFDRAMRPRGDLFRSAVARSSSRELRPASAANQAMRISRRQRPACE